MRHFGKLPWDLIDDGQVTEIPFHGNSASLLLSHGYAGTRIATKIAEDAHLKGNEYGWEASFFPAALANAQTLGYACTGGQFQFRLDNGTCEMCWLSADSDPRHGAESWANYCECRFHKFWHA